VAKFNVPSNRKKQL